ncbi:Transmembrane protein 165 [Lamellibrachia satsuma]|nr:Transmembrane protein 165 [Lamellibrachia satsuma]
MSHPKHSNEDSSHEKDVGALQPLHAVLPGEESVHSETARPALKKMAEMAARDPYGHLVVKEAKFTDIKFIHAFVASLSVIIVSEIGDKTFFIAAIMAMRHSRITVFAGAIGALATMTILSAMLGFATTVIPRWFTYYVSTALFFLFGLKMLKEGYDMSPDEGQEELEEVQADLRKKDEEGEKQDVETGVIRTPQRRILYSLFSRIFIQSFTLTFLAEWGDRSQITTIILAAREDVLGVIIGGTLGHALCTGFAVIGGRFIAQMISVRTVTLVGGVVFLLFAVSSLIIQPA